jgi:4-amino-4-deoxy-L-arabinose transferase-like glycosyltransferase
LPHYVMPMYPAIAMLAGKALIDGFPALGERRWRWLPPLAIGAWLMVGTALALGLALGPYVVDRAWNGLTIGAGAFLLVVQGVALFLLFQRKTSSIYVLAFGSMILVACAFGVILPSLKHVWISRQVVQIAEGAKKCDKLQIISATYNEPSLIFMAGTNTEFVPSGAMAAIGMWLDTCKIGLIDEEHAKSFAGAFPDKSYQPTTVGTVEGFNAGRGRPIKMTLYTLPPRSKAP